MILGIVASEDTVPAAQADGLRAEADFAAGAVTVDGETLALADVLDRPENVTPGFGVILGFDHVVEVLGTLAERMLTANATYLVEFYRIDTRAIPIEITDDDGGGSPLIRIFDNKSLGFFAASDSFPFPATGRDLDVDYAGGMSENGVLHCAALTRTDAKIAISLDQGDVISDGTDNPASGLTKVFIGGFDTGWPMIVRRLKVFDPLADEVLPTISTTSGAFPVAPNNDFANALPIEVGQRVYALNNGCGKETGEPDHAGVAGGKTLWWDFIAPASGDYKFVFWESTLAPSVVSALYTGASVDSLTEVVSDNDVDWELTFTAVEGETYHLALQGGAGVEGFFSVSLAAA